MQSFVLLIDGLGYDTPPVLWVPHSVAHELCTAAISDRIARGALVSSLLDAGLKGVMVQATYQKAVIVSDLATVIAAYKYGRADDSASAAD